MVVTVHTVPLLKYLVDLAGNGGTEGDGETSREKRFLQHLMVLQRSMIASALRMEQRIENAARPFRDRTNPRGRERRRRAVSM